MNLKLWKTEKREKGEGRQEKGGETWDEFGRRDGRGQTIIGRREERGIHGEKRRKEGRELDQSKRRLFSHALHLFFIRLKEV